MNENFMGTMRNLNGLLRSSTNNKELLKGITSVMQQTTNANVLLTKNTGEVLAWQSNNGQETETLISQQKNQFFLDNKVSGQLKKIKETKKVSLDGLEKFNSLVLPIDKNSSILMYKEEDFSEEDLVNAELCANNAAIVNHQMDIEKSEAIKRNTDSAKNVIDNLSFTELDVIKQVFAELENGCGFIVASKIADKNGYARSVTVNALKKLESAEVIQTRSLGVKGTYIKTINPKFVDEIKNYKS